MKEVGYGWFFGGLFLAFVKFIFLQIENILVGHSCILPLNILTPELFCLLLFYIGMMAHVDKLQSICVCLCVKEALSKDKLVTYMITAFCLFRGIFSSSLAQIL